MSAEVKKEIELEIAYVLFIDIVGYSKLLIDQQRRLLELLNEIVRGTEQFRKAEASHRLITIPTGDGMALVFYNAPEAPVECALEISRAAREHPELKLRMGVHSGPVSGVVDVSGRANIAGAGINIAQRVMDCGDAEHILLSRHVAEDLEQLGHWKKHLHDLGEAEVKHGSHVSVVNLYTEELGNPEVPQKFLQARHKAAAAVPLAPEKPRTKPQLDDRCRYACPYRGTCCWADIYCPGVRTRQGREPPARPINNGARRRRRCRKRGIPTCIGRARRVS